MKPGTVRRCAAQAGLIASCLVAGLSFNLHAQLSVEAIVTPLNGSFQYDITVSNNGFEDVAIVSFTDAPLFDPLIGPSLIAPAGFLGSYDPGLGFVDLLADTGIFGMGTSVGGFSFQSLAPPGVNFTAFQALGVNGTSFSGSTVIPETHTSLAAVGVVGCVLWALYRRFRNCS
jgi:hypothetical protein